MGSRLETKEGRCGKDKVSKISTHHLSSPNEMMADLMLFLNSPALGIRKETVKSPRKGHRKPWCQDEATARFNGSFCTSMSELLQYDHMKPTVDVAKTTNLAKRDHLYAKAAQKRLKSDSRGCDPVLIGDSAIRVVNQILHPS